MLSYTPMHIRIRLHLLNLTDTLIARRVLFRKCDVSNWDDVLNLFEEAWKTFGIINAVLSNAGISNENFLKDEIDADTGKLLPPNIKTLDVNLTGTIYVAKCAVHYFKKWPETRCQLVMTGSAASFVDTPPLHLYCASKAGILGFMRSLRTQLIKNNNVTVNMIAPWMTSKFYLGLIFVFTPCVLHIVLEMLTILQSPPCFLRRSAKGGARSQQMRPGASHMPFFFPWCAPMSTENRCLWLVIRSWTSRTSSMRHSHCGWESS
jgi:NAD(P)-dependent dehydrogenase (short-subunit alcohol dehydrogenase family)